MASQKVFEPVEVKKTVCTLAAGKNKYFYMALAMMQSVREHSENSVERYVIFSDRIDWAYCPSWIQLVALPNLANSMVRFDYWSLKPVMLNHPDIENDLVLYLDSDLTVYRNIFDECFSWIERHSVLMSLQWRRDDEMWGKFNLGKIYRDAGYRAKNLTINNGIIGRKPDKLGFSFLRNWSELMNAGVLKNGFDDEMSRKNDEPYAGLAYQLAHLEVGSTIPANANPFSPGDYVITVGADRSQFSRKPGPVVSVPWCSYDFVQPSVVHWVDHTNALFYHKTVWMSLYRGKMLGRNLLPLTMAEVSDLFLRLKVKLRTIMISGKLRS